MRIDGQPWEQVPSGSTMQLSLQQAGAVASNRALRTKDSKLSGVSENPSFSRASVALIRYGLWDLVFIICEGINCPWNHRLSRDGSPENSSHGFDEMPFSLPVGRDENRLNPVS